MASESSEPMRERVTKYILSLQDDIVSAFEKLDPGAPPFKRDSWVRAQGGEGTSCVFAVPPAVPGAAPAPATVLEKAGVNISVVHGLLPPAAVRQMRADHASIPPGAADAAGRPFFAAGISLVVHPRNPSAPTVHANYRYFEITDAPEGGEAEGGAEADGGAARVPQVVAWWFGGGCDLTPSYLFEEDAVHFHGTLKAACDAHGGALFPAFKAWCDEYFFLPHRGETRGVGGIFFDDLTAGAHARLPGATARPHTAEEIFAFVRACGAAFVPSYLPILQRRLAAPADEHRRRWQLLRRGRYVEFNLVYDRGTKFGLMTPGARIESILMSLPETARWEYMSDLGTDANSEEGKLVEVLKNPRDWV